jgi:hypothetical protein
MLRSAGVATAEQRKALANDRIASQRGDADRRVDSHATVVREPHATALAVRKRAQVDYQLGPSDVLLDRDKQIRAAAHGDGASFGESSQGVGG